VDYPIGVLSFGFNKDTTVVAASGDVRGSRLPTRAEPGKPNIRTKRVQLKTVKSGSPPGAFFVLFCGYSFLPLSMHGLRCRYQLDRDAAAEVTVLKQRYCAQTAAAALFTPHRDCNRVLSIWIQDTRWYRKDSFWPQIVNINAHLPTVDEDQSAIRR